MGKESKTTRGRKRKERVMREYRAGERGWRKRKEEKGKRKSRRRKQNV